MHEKEMGIIPQFADCGCHWSSISLVYSELSFAIVESGVSRIEEGG